MAKVQNYSGIDVSKQSFDVCIELGDKTVKKNFSYTEEGMTVCLMNSRFILVQNMVNSMTVDPEFTGYAALTVTTNPVHMDNNFVFLP